MCRHEDDRDLHGECNLPSNFKAAGESKGDAWLRAIRPGEETWRDLSGPGPVAAISKMNCLAASVLTRYS